MSLYRVTLVETTTYFLEVHADCANHATNAATDLFRDADDAKRLDWFSDGEFKPLLARLACHVCKSPADLDGYCTEPGCTNQGKVVE